MSSPITEIKTFVANNRTSDALARLLELSQNNKQIHDSILIVLADFNDLNAQKLRGTISSEAAILRHNKINERVLMALDAFDGEGRVLPGSAAVKKPLSAAGILGRITLVLWGGTGLLIIGWYATRDHTFDDFSAILAYLGLFSFIGYILALVVGAARSK